MRKVRISFCVLMLFAIFGIGACSYFNTNRMVENYKNTRYNFGDKIIYNNTSVVMNNLVIATLDEIKENYGVSAEIIQKTLDDYGDSLVYAVYKVDVLNEGENLSYFDFTHFTIEVDNWFSWMSMDFFREMNPKLNNKLRICMYPGTSTEVFVPFMLYHDNDEDNFVYRQLNDGVIQLNLGIYPQKYYLITNTKKFKAEGLNL